MSTRHCSRRPVPWGAGATAEGQPMAHEWGTDRGLARFTLKDANAFLLTDALGDIDSPDSGLFWDDTRMLSRLQLQVAESRPSLLGAAVSQDNVRFTAHLTNRPLPAPGEHSIPQGVIHLERTRFEMIAERKLRRRQLAADGNVEITGRDLREKTPPVGRGSLFARATG